MTEHGSIIYVEDLTVSFDGFKALDALNFFMDYGELRLVIGPNGAGKTTLLDVICGKVKPAKGRVIFGRDSDISTYREHEIAQLGIGRKFQTPSIYLHHTVRENLELSLHQNKSAWAMLFRRLSSEDGDRVEEILDMIGLAEKPYQIAGSLSHGEKQWLEIGMVMAQEAQLLLIDEPVAGMTEDETEKTGRLLQAIAKERSVLVIEHDMQFVRQIANKVSVLHEGRLLCEGPVDEVQNNEQVMEIYLGRG
ncbi:MAG: urea ABC transporter ATP-binding protein UrtD [Nitrospiraceae bacterium]|nr:urea ABC transporter ATP-binding protein UrtD [Nitrospiraceae bacterium]|tara:strand:+ start:1090 stop:1839 length:750 start_codon:yes stop_codon:yes gene_type:complete